MYVSIIFVSIISKLVAGDNNSDSFFRVRENFTNYETGGLSTMEEDNVNPHQRVARQILKVWTTNTCRCGELDGIIPAHYRIVGGIDAKAVYPWQALILVYKVTTKRHKQCAADLENSVKHNRKSRDYDYICGGTIINDKYILTSADCVHATEGVIQPNLVNAVLGVHNGDKIFISPNTNQFHVVKDIIIPDQYVSSGKDDIALLRLCQWITYNELIKPICLPNNDENIEGLTATVIGWGKDGFVHKPATNLQEATVKVLKNDECGGEIDDTHFCATGKNDDHPYLATAVKEDYGGPVFYTDQNGRAVQIGISSIYNNELTLPSYFTKLSMFIEWIHEKTARDGTYCRG